MQSKTVTRALTPEKAKALVEKSLDADKAQDIVTIPLKDSSALADYMIIATGTSSRHVNALAQKLKEKLEKAGQKHIRTEGLSQGDWVIMDTGDIIIHIFRSEVRAFYNLEKMWTMQTPPGLAGQQAQAW
ncbi:MAG: ribosome silencing factor [Alphaproteobacteria bacterium]|nr:ribosome silencing factor [Alphaproteobacteria bacterium]MBP7757647.1 ribosome silencing factor [Alphaproteobacteria bacterium]MBP7761153.1 ribosome silencing factor [Alphaproteobacteria bacterium]MBP7905164.1 ribosome silencing factor [Alphaproteobacteria bacterium]